MIRAQRLLASVSGLSRRAAEALIIEGRVAFSPTPSCPVAAVSLGQALPPTTVLLVDGRALPGSGVPPQPHIYLALHKPPKVLSAWAPQAHAPRTSTLTDVLQRWPPPGRPNLSRLVHVGRLDFDSEGLLLLTSDGVWANGIAHPSAGVSKEYLVACAAGAGYVGAGTADLCRALTAGVALIGEARLARAAAAALLPLAQAREAFAGCQAPLQPQAPGLGAGALAPEVLRIVLQGEGRQRVLRRMLAACGFGVQRLLRVGVGGLGLGALQAGQCRALSQEEVAGLRTQE